jgi:hypothetical protein
MTDESDRPRHLSPDDRQALAAVVESLRARFPAVPAAVVEEHVQQAAAGYADVTIRDFVAVLVERQVRQRLNELPVAPASGSERGGDAVGLG